MATFAEALGKSEQHSQFLAAANSSTAALHRAFWNGSAYNVQHESLPRGHHPQDQTLAALPLWLGATPPSARSSAQQFLVQSVEQTKRHITAGILGTKFLLPALEFRRRCRNLLPSRLMHPSLPLLRHGAGGCGISYEDGDAFAYLLADHLSELLFDLFQTLPGLFQTCSLGM